MNIIQVWNESRKFLKEVKLEIKRIVWPKRNEWIGSTIIVIIIIVAFSCFLWGVEQVFYNMAKKIF
jgi:preprotein translocase subunit SecE